MELIKRKVSRKKHTDSLMKNLWLSLVRDFRNNLNSPSFGMRHELALKSGIKCYREEPPVVKWYAPNYVFKCTYQLENLFKRYVFEDDLYTQEDLASQALDGFKAFQQQLASPRQRSSSLEYMVVQEARKIISSILGPLDPSELHSYVQFGKRANKGVPYSESYLDVKVCVLSGSEEHQTWFNTYLESDPMLRDVIEKRPDFYKNEGPFRERPSSLTATAVPKSFKANRIIMPNTVIGTLYTYALGAIIEDRLARVGLNIRSLQKKHGLYAKAASKSRHLVTADLSKASDLFTAELVNRLVPRDWYNALKLGRIKTVDIKGEAVYLTSFMAMGIGYTFTLQTLMFYAILKSMARLANVKGLISVYGDDLIYPRKLHKYVRVLFPLIGLTLNEDKTFVNLPFRESCGSDFFNGIDVRPYQPQQVGTSLGVHEYRAFCYKLLNGLLNRWDKTEIPSTIHLLMREILSVDDSIKVVPPDFPDTAGWRCNSFNFQWYVPVSEVVWNKDLQCHSFKYWRSVSQDRYVRFVYPYLWEKLRTMESKSAPSPFDKIADSHILRWVKLPYGAGKSYRGKFSGKWHKPLGAAVAAKHSMRTLLQEGYCYSNLGTKMSG